jgi:hypothetical protein
MTEAPRLVLNTVLYTGLIWGPVVMALTGDSIFGVVGVIAFITALFLPPEDGSVDRNDRELDGPISRAPKEPAPHRMPIKRPNPRRRLKTKW